MDVLTADESAEMVRQNVPMGSHYQHCHYIGENSMEMSYMNTNEYNGMIDSGS
ncbi:hypothetical protein I79_000379 [Cricetulus griseus]|uniref:Uncharacterized protein n=1 Tax=Cricetulus griseus TaxID=10029 RepID=G3GS66_CRIGR|nr:hypothetical protein I79_000379 [Cricetulus griseus]